jgi:hypothetical protein
MHVLVIPLTQPAPLPLSQKFSCGLRPQPVKGGHMGLDTPPETTKSQLTGSSLKETDKMMQAPTGGLTRLNRLD